MLWPLAAEEIKTHHPGWLSRLGEWLNETLHLGLDPAPEALLYAWFIVIPGLAALVWVGTRRMEKVPGGLQNLLEGVVEALTSFCRNIIGERFGDRFAPFIGALFMYIFLVNVVGIIPGVQAATSNINQTVALALCTFVATQYAGFRYAGFGYVKHFAGEPLWLAPLMFPIHVVSEIARPISLTLRLFGNIFGEETAIAIFLSLAVYMTGSYIPFQLPMVALAVFTSFVQALIFALLSSVYIGGALPHLHAHPEHEHVGHGHEAADKAVH